MKKIIYAIVILVMILSVENIFDRYDQRQPTKYDLTGVLVSTFDSAGIYESESTLEGTYYYGSMYLTEDSAHELLGRLADYIGVEGGYEFTRNVTETGYESVLYKEAEQSTVRLKLITVEQTEEHLVSQQQYISVLLAIDNSVGSAFYYRTVVTKAMEQLFAELEKKTKVTDEYTVRAHRLIDSLDVSVKGKIRGYVWPEQQKEIAQGFIEAIGAEMIFDNLQEQVPIRGDGDNTTEEAEDMPQLYSLYAYTPEIRDYVAIGKNRINVNVVYTYNAEENVTCIHVGSPIINYDY